MGYGQELASALAGPLANLLAAAILGRMGCTTAAGANGVLCAFNLLPVRPLDGGPGAVSPAGVAGRSRNGGMGRRWVGISTALAAASRDGVAGVAHGGKPLAAPCRSGIAVGRGRLAG